MAAIQQNARHINKGLIDLLYILGPQAIANDPGLPLRLRNRAQKLPDIHPSQRQQLTARMQLQEGHQNSTGSGIGIEHVGTSLQGDLRTLLPSQLALPWDLFNSRYLRQELLYRARKGQLAPSLRPMVIILDVTPPNFGPIEGMTRLAAHILATTLLRANINSLLITTGETVRVHRISRQADIIEIWTERSVFPADIPQTLKVAQTLRRTLNQGGNEAGIILLSHSWFGGANSKYIIMPGLRALFVNYPKQQIEPPFGQYCEQYKVLGYKDFSQLPDVLGRLMG